MPETEPRPLNNSISRLLRHTHPDDERMDVTELWNHMVRYHGWTIRMVFQRGGIDDGEWVRHRHHRHHHGDWPRGPVRQEW